MWHLDHLPPFLIDYPPFTITKSPTSNLLHISSPTESFTFNVLSIKTAVLKNGLCIISYSGYHETKIIFYNGTFWNSKTFPARYLIHSSTHIYLLFSSIILTFNGKTLTCPDNLMFTKGLEFLYRDRKLSIYFHKISLLLEDITKIELSSDKDYIHIYDATEGWQTWPFSLYTSPNIWLEENKYYIRDDTQFYTLPIRKDKYLTLSLQLDQASGWWNHDYTIFYLQHPGNHIQAFAKPIKENIKFLSLKHKDHIIFLLWLISADCQGRMIKTYIPKSLFLSKILPYLNLQ